MRSSVDLVFDEFVSGTNPVYSSRLLDAVLGAYDRVSLQVVADQVGGVSPRITVTMETSLDGETFEAKSLRPEISAENLVAGRTNVFYGTDDASETALPYGRIEVRLEGTAPRARLKVWACGRDSTVRPKPQGGQGKQVILADTVARPWYDVPGANDTSLPGDLPSLLFAGTSLSQPFPGAPVAVFHRSTHGPSAQSQIMASWYDGTQWGPAESVSQEIPVPSGPSAAAAPGGAIFVAFISDSLDLYVRTNGPAIPDPVGAVSSVSTSVWVDVGGDGAGPVLKDAYDAVIAVDPQTGEPCLAVIHLSQPLGAQTTFGLSVYRFDTQVKAWVPQATTISDVLARPALAFAPSGDLYVAFSPLWTQFKLTVFKLPQGSMAWIPVGPPGISQQAAQGLSMVAPGGRREVIVAFRDAAAGGGTSVMSFQKGQGLSVGSWKYLGPQNIGGGSSKSQRIAINPITGGIVVAHVVKPPFGLDTTLHVSEWDSSSSSWLPVGQILPSPPQATSVALAINQVGSPFVLYAGKATDGYLHALMYTGWEILGGGTSDSFVATDAYWPSLAFDSNGLLAVAYSQFDPTTNSYSYTAKTYDAFTDAWLTFPYSPPADALAAYTGNFSSKGLSAQGSIAWSGNWRFVGTPNPFVPYSVMWEYAATPAFPGGPYGWHQYPTALAPAVIENAAGSLFIAGEPHLLINNGQTLLAYVRQHFGPQGAPLDTTIRVKSLDAANTWLNLGDQSAFETLINMIPQQGSSLGPHEFVRLAGIVRTGGGDVCVAYSLGQETTFGGVMQGPQDIPWIWSPRLRVFDQVSNKWLNATDFGSLYNPSPVHGIQILSMATAASKLYVSLLLYTGINQFAADIVEIDTTGSEWYLGTWKSISRKVPAALVAGRRFKTATSRYFVVGEVAGLLAVGPDGSLYVLSYFYNGGSDVFKPGNDPSAPVEHDVPGSPVVWRYHPTAGWKIHGGGGLTTRVCGYTDALAVDESGRVCVAATVDVGGGSFALQVMRY